VRFRALAAATLLTALALAGCAGIPGTPEPTPTSTLADDIAALPGVASARQSDVTVYVEVELDAADDVVLAAVDGARELAVDRSWAGEVIVARVTGPLDPVTDIQPPTPWDTTVYPGDDAEVRQTVLELLAIEKVPDVVRVALIDGWPHVVLGSLETFTESFRILSALPQFADGATYSYVGEQPRLHIVHLPERMSGEAIEAVIRIAVENPESEVELQSLTTPGNRWPELWVARLTEEQRARVDTQLRDPSLADTDPEGYSIPFQLSVLGPNGPELSWGTFGDVPDTSS
jgi:hypothetical protein